VDYQRVQDCFEQSKDTLKGLVWYGSSAGAAIKVSSRKPALEIETKMPLLLNKEIDECSVRKV